MRKSILVVLFAMVCGSVFAAGASNQDSCESVRTQVKNNHDIIDKAYHSNDGCTMGKLMIQNRHLIESNMACFPKLEQLMEQRQKLQSNN